MSVDYYADLETVNCQCVLDSGVKFAQAEYGGRRSRESEGTGALCTFLPQWAEAPIQQSQDKAGDYG